jgi:hypothetical protein
MAQIGTGIVSVCLGNCRRLRQIKQLTGSRPASRATPGQFSNGLFNTRARAGASAISTINHRDQFNFHDNAAVFKSRDGKMDENESPASQRF